MLLSILGHVASSTPQTQPPPEPRDVGKILHEFHRRQAAAYEFFIDSEPDRKLEFRAKPVMSWTREGGSPVGWSGDVFVWTREGRAAVVGCVGSGPTDDGRRGVFHEFHSLALGPLSPVSIGDGWQWTPAGAAIELRAVENAPAPAESPQLRLAQMRDLAGRFTAQMQENSEEKEAVLRLMPQPIFRYDKGNRPAVSDGAIFAFVFTQGTDPELLLLLECRDTPSGPRWHYAPVRFTWRALWLRLGDQEVWRVGEHDETWRTRVLKKPYATVRGKPVSLDELTESQPKKK
jgi:hypothetical protein